MLECSWRAGTVRVPAPPGSVGISPACRPAASWERGHLARMPHGHLLGAWASRPHAALPLPGGVGIAPARRPAASWERGRLACTPHCHLLGTRASRPHTALPPPGGAGVSPVYSGDPLPERGHLDLDCPTKARRSRPMATSADGERTLLLKR
jgi:hypothetical protein